MGTLESTRESLLKPTNYSNEILSKAGVATYKESAYARLCFVAQIIVSVIAIPTLLIVGLGAVARDLYNGNDIAPAFIEMGKSIRHLAAFALPVSVVGFFAPLSTTASLAASLDVCVLKNEAVKTA